MLEQLPTELVLAIFCEAAEIFVVCDRQSALAIALTSALAYNNIRSILLRRVILNNSNKDAIKELLQHAVSSAMILDLTLASDWNPPSAIFCNLTGLRCLRGYDTDIISAIAGLPSSGLASLFKIQTWAPSPLPVVPPSITHVSPYNIDVGDPPLDYLIEWLNSTPALTHLGCEFVSRGDNLLAEDLTPQKLMDGLDAVFHAGGQRLSEVSIRLCGEGFTAPSNWARYVEALRGAEWAYRLRLWRDPRDFSNPTTDLEASIDDSFLGVDLWSEARPLEAFISDQADERGA